MKKRSYKLSLPRWALAQRESWYAELAARGLRVQKAGAMLTRFAPAPPEFSLILLSCSLAQRRLSSW